MIKLPFPDIIKKIKEAKGLTEQEIESKVEDKLKQLSGLVSKEGAAHIIANELGVKLFENLSGRLEIKNILAGMRNVETVGRVMQIFEAREFQTENRTGKVGSFILGDSSGSIRITCWGDQCDNLSKLNQNDIVRISSGYVKENNGRKEVHLNEKSSIVISPPGIDVPEVSNASVRKQIKDLTADDDKVEVLATIVQVFEPRFFEVCATCNKRAKPKEDKFECPTHGIINPKFSYVINCFIDDGTDNIRATFFKDQADKLTRKTTEAMVAYKENIEAFDEVKNELAGKIVKIDGRIRKNEMFDRLEFIANDIDLDPDPDAEIEKLNKEAEKINKIAEEEVTE